MGTTRAFSAVVELLLAISPAAFYSYWRLICVRKTSAVLVLLENPQSVWVEVPCRRSLALFDISSESCARGGAKCVEEFL